MRLSSSQAAVEDKPDPAYHNIVTNTEKPTGNHQHLITQLKKNDNLLI